jgi:hypothetical protein
MSSMQHQSISRNGLVGADLPEVGRHFPEVRQDQVGHLPLIHPTTSSLVSKHLAIPRRDNLAQHTDTDTREKGRKRRKRESARGIQN